MHFRKTSIFGKAIKCKSYFSFREHFDPERKRDERYDPLLSNWIRCARGLHFVQTGLKSFVEKELAQQHTSIVRSLRVLSLVHCQSCGSERQRASSCKHDKLNCDQCPFGHCADTISSQCSKCSFKKCQHCKERFCKQCNSSSHVLRLCDCTAETILPLHKPANCQYKGKKKCNCRKPNAKACSRKTCGRMHDEILDLHTSKDPLFSNSDPRLWIKSSWEFGKCFLGTPVNKKIDICGIDAAGFLSICINNRNIHANIQTLNAFLEVGTVKSFFFREREREGDGLIPPFICKMETLRF